MKSFLLSLCFIGFMQGFMAQDLPAYQLFDAAGKSIKHKKVQQQLEKADIICFGELHNNPIAHWLELEWLRSLIRAKGADQVVCGAEMFETDQQAGLDSLFKGDLTPKVFAEQYKLWRNYDTDYQPIVALCMDEDVPLIASNCPRRLARLVAQQGIDSLQGLAAEEQALVAPLPITIDYNLATYAAMKDMLGPHHGEASANQFIAAQAIKDATMAHRILIHWEPGQVFYHLNGSYHSKQKEGIVWYLQQANPDLKILTISIVEQDEIQRLADENLHEADIIVAVPTSMTKTYISAFE